MTDEGIPNQIQLFIFDHIHSVEALEMLLLLREAPGEALSAETAAQRLRTSKESAATRLLELKQAGLARIAEPNVPTYQSVSGDAALESLIAELEKIYKERRVSVISLIYSKPSARIRAFSDAFRLRKEEP